MNMFKTSLVVLLAGVWLTGCGEQQQTATVMDKRQGSKDL